MTSLEMGIEPNTEGSVWFDQPYGSVWFGFGCDPNVWVSFGSIRNGLRMVFKFGVFGSIPISSLQLYHTAKNNIIKHPF